MKKVNMLNVIVLFFTLFFISNLFAQSQGDERVLMTIGGDDVTVAEFMNVYNKNNVNNDMVDKKSIQEYLDLYINFKLKVKEAKDLGMDTAATFVKELDGYRKQLAEPYFIDEKVNENLLRTAYDRMKTDVRASHILVKCDENAPPVDTMAAYEKIMKIRERILNGEDFSVIAATESDDPTAADRPGQEGRPGRKGNHGDLGYFSVFDMIYSFEETAYNTPVGEISMPVRTNYGYHLIKVTDRSEALGRAQVAHIYLSFPSFPTKEDSLNNEKKANDIYQELVNGANWDEMVKKYSADKGTIDRGGVLPWFGSNRMVPEFIQTVKTLRDSGDISQPILTMFGWHIIQLKDRKVPGTYEEEKENLKRRLIKDSRAKKSREAVIARIKKEYGYQEYPGNFQEVLLTIDSSFLKNQWKVSQAANLNGPVFILGDGTTTQQDFAEYIEKNQIKRGIKQRDPFLKELTQNFIDENCLDYEDKRLEDKYPEFKMLMQEYRDGILLFNLTDEKVWSKAVKDTVGLNAFYKDNKNNYMWNERIDATIYIINEGTDPDLLREKIKSGSTDEDILNTFNTDEKEVVFIETGKFEKGDNPLIDNTSWSKGISKIYKVSDFPGLKNKPGISDNALAVVKTNRKLKPEPKTLKEARGIITSDYQNYLENEWIKELKGKYEVVVNPEVLSTIK